MGICLGRQRSTICCSTSPNVTDNRLDLAEVTTCYDSPQNADEMTTRGASHLIQVTTSDELWASASVGRDSSGAELPVLVCHRRSRAVLCPALCDATDCVLLPVVSGRTGQSVAWLGLAGRVMRLHSTELFGGGGQAAQGRQV